MSAAQELEVDELARGACSSAAARSRRSRPSGRSRRAAGSRTSRSSSASPASTAPSARSRRSSAFLQEISLVSDQDTLADEQSLVTLMTIHNAKGLEFRAVFLIGMEEGIFPHSRSIEDNEIEEERRLAYVGMTRAMERLTLTHAMARSLYGRREYNLAVALPRRAAGRGRARAAAPVVVVGLRRRPRAGVGRRRPARRARSRRSRPATRSATARSARASSRGSSRAASSRCASRRTERAEADARVRAAREDR